MAYIVLARKWRPMNFEDVLGQEHITKILSNALKNERIAHAYIFAGPRGVGKTSTARLLAKAVNCATVRTGKEVSIGYGQAVGHTVNRSRPDTSSHAVEGRYLAFASHEEHVAGLDQGIRIRVASVPHNGLIGEIGHYHAPVSDVVGMGRIQDQVVGVGHGGERVTCSGIKLIGRVFLERP